jgi:hypothetical protein
VDPRVSRLRAWLDTTPLAAIGLTLMREATGHTEPQLLEPVRPSRPERLRPDARIGFWALGAGVGTSTTAALVAQRSAAAGHAPLLVDLDRWAPSLALRGARPIVFDRAAVASGEERLLLAGTGAIARWIRA